MAKRRKNGEGTIRLRKDGRWEGRVVIGYDKEGLPRTKGVLAKTKAECAKKLDELKAAITPETPVKVKPDMTLGDWLDYWYQSLAKPGLRVTTQQAYENWLYCHLIPGVGHIPLNKLTQADLQQFFTDMKKNGRQTPGSAKGTAMSDRSVRSCHAICRMALDRAVRENLLRKNPAEGCKLPPLKGREMQVLTREELQRFLIQAKEEGMYELFLLELTTGLRRGELLGLQWDDLDLKAGTLKIDRQIYPVKGKLTVNKPKTKAGVRTIILPPPVLEVLREYKEQVFSPWLFPSRLKPDQPIDPGYIRKRLQAILERAGCKKVRFHDLRHTFATMALENGMDVKTLSAIIGHVSSGTTLNIYAHVTDEMRRTAAAKIDRGIAKAEVEETVGEREEPEKQPFTPVKPPRRRPGTGCVSKINDHLWEGRYSPVWPDGKKHARNIYAKTEAECEEKLKALIREMKAEIAQARKGAQNNLTY